MSGLAISIIDSRSAEASIGTGDGFFHISPAEESRRVAKDYAEFVEIEQVYLKVSLDSFEESLRTDLAKMKQVLEKMPTAADYRHATNHVQVLEFMDSCQKLITMYDDYIQIAKKKIEFSLMVVDSELPPTISNLLFEVERVKSKASKLNRELTK